MLATERSNSPTMRGTSTASASSSVTAWLLRIDVKFSQVKYVSGRSAEKNATTATRIPSSA
jgi:hypothetical protein